MKKKPDESMDKSRDDALSRTDEIIDIVELDDDLLDDAVGGGTNQRQCVENSASNCGTNCSPVFVAPRPARSR